MARLILVFPKACCRPAGAIWARFPQSHCRKPDLQAGQHAFGDAARPMAVPSPSPRNEASHKLDLSSAQSEFSSLRSLAGGSHETLGRSLRANPRFHARCLQLQITTASAKTGVKAQDSPGRSLSGGCMCSDVKERAWLYCKPHDFIIC